LQIGTKALVFQPRDRLLLEKLALLRLLDRDQIARLAGFHSISRVNVRLGKLRNAGLVVRYFTATSTGSRRSVYALTKRGAAVVQVPFTPLKWSPDSVLMGNALVAHQLAMSVLYTIASADRAIRWKAFTVPLTPNTPLIPDSYIEEASQSFFLEMDLGTESLSIWERKTALYLKLALTGAYSNVVPNSRFAVLVIATTDARLESLRRQVLKQTSKLFWFATLDTIKRQGFWSPCWLRATGTTRSPPGA
jgi:hypothetical protein